MMTLLRAHQEGDCWAPCVWCWDDDARDERDGDDDDDTA